jgi:hypothetical protein
MGASARKQAEPSDGSTVSGAAARMAALALAVGLSLSVAGCRGPAPARETPGAPAGSLAKLTQDLAQQAEDTAGQVALLRRSAQLAALEAAVAKTKTTLASTRAAKSRPAAAGAAAAKETLKLARQAAPLVARTEDLARRAFLAAAPSIGARAGTADVAALETEGALPRLAAAGPAGRAALEAFAAATHARQDYARISDFQRQARADANAAWAEVQSTP